MNTTKINNLDNTIKEHYVPRFYLERFSNPSKSGNEQKIWIFNKLTQKSFLHNIDTTATGNYFYDFLFDFIEEDKKKTFDTDLQKLEDFIAPFYKKFEKRLYYILKSDERKQYKIRVLNNNQKQVWAKFLAAQALRTPEFRNLLQEVKQKTDKAKITEYFLEQQVQKHIKPIKRYFPESNIEYAKEFLANQTSQLVNNLYTKESISLLHYDFFKNHIHKLQKIFLTHKWTIGINQTNIPFYTSDHPVVKNPYFMTGYSSEGVEIMFPVNSKTIFVIREKEHPRSNDGDCKLVNLSEEEVTGYNAAQVYCSNQFIYCQENNFELAQEICKNNHDAFSEDRNRVIFISNE